MNTAEGDDTQASMVRGSQTEGRMGLRAKSKRKNDQACFKKQKTARALSAVMLL